jgi:hypothetical protein
MRQEKRETTRQGQMYINETREPIPNTTPRVRTEHNYQQSLSFQDLRSVEGAEELYTLGTMPKVHCHCFTRELEKEKAIEDIQQVRVSLCDKYEWF